MIKYEYKGLNIEIADDGSSYAVYEITPILKNRHDALFGASVAHTYDRVYVEDQIDKALQELRLQKISGMCDKIINKLEESIALQERNTNGS